MSADAGIRWQKWATAAPTYTSKLTADQEQRLVNARQYAREIEARVREEQKTTGKLHGQTRTTVDAQLLSILSRIYVGSITFDLHERHLRAIFGSFGPIKTFNMSYDPAEKRHKGFCFIEFDTPDAANLAVSMLDSFNVGGRSLKVGRSGNYPTDGIKRLPTPPKSRLYVANIHDLVTETDIRDIFEPFGPLVAVSLPPDPISRRHKGYGFVEYENDNDAAAAASFLNGLEVALKPLRVAHAVMGGPMPKGMSDLKVLPKSILSIAEAINKSVAENTQESNPASKSKTRQQAPSGSMDVDKDEEIPAMPVIEDNVEFIATDKPKDISPVVHLMNVVGPDEVDDELEQEMRQECEKYGPVKQIKIHVETTLDEPQVSVFVEYGTSTSAQIAINALDGRWFGGRKISARLYSKQEYDDGILQ